MVEKKLAESHASLERRFELLAKQLLEHGQHTPGEVRRFSETSWSYHGWLVGLVLVAPYTIFGRQELLLRQNAVVDAVVQAECGMT